MYFNGPQSKNSSSNESRRVNYRDTNQQSLLICKKQITNKLNNIQTELKDDLNKSLTRLLRATSSIQQTSRPACHNKLQQAAGVSKKDCCPNKQVSATIHGRLTSMSSRADGRWQSNQTRLKQQRSLVGSHQSQGGGDWKTSLKRSLSHNLIQISVTKDHQQHAARRTGGANSRLSDTKRHFKNDISCQFNRCGSWLTNLHRQSSLTATALLILFSFILAATSGINDAAPIISPASIQQPLWLGGSESGGSIDTESIGGGDGNVESTNDAGAIVYGGPEGIYLQPPPQQPEEAQIIDELELGVPPGSIPELFRLQRRRLDRERALEPPPWMREQPMRRGGFNPAGAAPEEEGLREEQVQVQQQVFNEDSLNQESGTVETDGASYPTVLGRQSRQLNGQIYEDLLRHLFEEAMDNQALVADVYDELERSLSKSSNVGSSSSQQQVSGQQQKLASNGGNLEGAGQDNQAQADSTLVVAGDEVSSGDDLAQTQTLTTTNNKSQRPALNAAYTQDILTGYGGTSDGLKQVASNNQADSLSKLPLEPSMSGKDNNASGARTNSSSSGFYLSFPLIGSMLRRPNVDSSSSMTSVDSVDVVDQQQQQQRDSFSLPDSQRTQTVSPSFHVIEDIDQTDNAQDSSALAYPADGQVDPQQQHQFAEQTEFLQSKGGAYPGGAGPMKRDTAIWAQRAQVAPAQQQQQQQHIQSSSEAQVSSEQVANESYNKWTGANTSASVIKLVQSGYLSRDQLMQLASKFVGYLEQAIGLSPATIQSSYPISAEKLLIKLDTKKLNVAQMINMIQNYELARGYIIVNWTEGNEENPLLLLATILRMLALNNAEENNDDDQELLDLVNLEQKLATGSAPMKLHENGAMLLSGGRNQPLYRYLFEDKTSGTKDQTNFGPIEPLRNNERYENNQRPPKTDNNNNRPSLSLAARLAAYLGVYPSSAANTPGQVPNKSKVTTWMPNLGGSAKPPLLLPDRWSSNLLIPEIGGLAMPAMMATAHAQVTAKNNNLFDGQDSHLVHLLILVVTILAAFLAVKLILHFADRRQLLKRRFENISGDLGGSLQSLWASKSHSTTVIGPGDKQKPLEEANFVNRRRQSSSSDTERLLEKEATGNTGGPRNEKKRLDLLAQKLVNLLSLYSSKSASKTTDAGETSAKENHDEEIDELANQIVVEVAENVEATGDDYADEADESNQPFRTSRSYIRSLINALTKANCSEISHSRLKSSSSPGKASDGGECPSKLQQVKLANNNLDLVETDEEPQEIVVSQMDISAAHLILAYMEKHLEDKEQLEREWQELNVAGGGSGQSSGSPPTATSSSSSSSSKINQLVLQRLAKVALNEENRYKNRNCWAVPYDRNRVKLGACLASAVAGATATATTTSTAGNKERKGRVNNTSSSSQVNDYINASYIHDDDLRRPTHIIAQGPSEQTSGQFWQMVWEQGVSVIVMLTRLNENSVKMCHCYWPTNANQVSQTGAAAASPSSSSSQSAGGCSSPPPPMSTASTVAANLVNGKQSNGKRQSGGGQPPSKTTTTTNGNGPPSPANGRRSSVTSVFSLVGNDRSGSGNNQPIVANGDLSNNVLYFDIFGHHNGGQRDDAGKIDEDTPTPTPTTTTSKQFKSSNSSGSLTKFEVHLVSEHVSSSDYLVRNMCLINRTTGETRTITQFHYLSWPEMGVPANVKSLLQFRRKVHKSYRNLKSPILVHCSDGTGRSGTYTLIDIILDRIKNGAKEIDPRATLEHLRDQRAGLCATKAQFEFVLMALAEEIQIILNALPQ